MFKKLKFMMYVLEIFKLNKCNMIVKYRDIEYLIFNEIDFKIIFKNFINI